MNTLPPLVSHLAVLLMAAGLVSAVLRRWQVPTLFGYLAAGMLVSPFVERAEIEVWAEIGIIFLLFAIGLEIGVKKLVQFGQRSLGAGTLALLLMMGFGVLLVRATGFTWPQAVLLGVALAFSSTAVIVQIIEEKGIKHKGFIPSLMTLLVVEDLLAVVVLTFVGVALVGGQAAETGWLTTILRLVFFFSLWFLVGLYLVPLLIQKFGRRLQSEGLLILGVGLCFFMSTLASAVGFSAALGAFLMGVFIATTPVAENLSQSLHPLRTLFTAVFFLSIGMLIDLRTVVDYPGAILLFTLFVVLGKFLFTLLAQLALGQTSKWSLQTALMMTQVAEFSFLIVQLGTRNGLVSASTFSIIVWVSLFSSAVTPLLAHFMPQLWTWFERKVFVPVVEEELQKYHQGLERESKSKIFLRFFAQAGLKIMLNIVVIVALLVGFRFGVQDLFTGWFLFAMKIATLVLSLPFLWGIWSAGSSRVLQRLEADPKYLLSVRIVVQVLLAIVTGLMALTLVQFLFGVSQSLWLFLAFIAALFMERRRVRSVYKGLEKRFIDTLQEKDRARATWENQSSLALSDWQFQLAKVRVSYSSPALLKTIQELDFRSQKGVLIVDIRRGSEHLFPPEPGTQILPGDELTLFGPESGLNEAIQILEKEAPQDISAQELILGHRLLHDDDPEVGLTLAESNLRETLAGLVVGIDRASGERIPLPTGQTLLLQGDQIWFVHRLITQ